MHRGSLLKPAVISVLIVAGVQVLGTPASADPAAKPQADCTIVGTQGDDVLKGGPGADVICALGGDDKLVGKDGKDTLRGGPGADVLKGGEGNDKLEGGAGNDELIGGSGDDKLGGGKGNDTLMGVDSAAYVDVLKCGPGGADSADADIPDVVKSSCEGVTQNDPPTDIALAPSTVAENRPVGHGRRAAGRDRPGPVGSGDVHPGGRHRVGRQRGVQRGRQRAADRRVVRLRDRRGEVRAGPGDRRCG